jgi:hypothetical protein
MTRALKRELRRRFNGGAPEPIVTRPGARFYVTAQWYEDTLWVLGPYASHMSALANVQRGRRLVEQTYGHDPRTWWLSFGSAMGWRRSGGGSLCGVAGDETRATGGMTTAGRGVGVRA